VDLGWCAVRTSSKVVGELSGRVYWSGWEVTVNVHGVVVTMPQGQSWAPSPSIETQ